MKKALLIIALCSTTVTYAQDLGKKLITGSFGFSSSKTKSNSSAPELENKNLSFSFNPSAGFFIGPNLALGVSATYNRSHTSSLINFYLPKGAPAIDLIKSTEEALQVGPFARLYKPVSNKFAFYGQSRAYYLYRSLRYEEGFTAPSSSNSQGIGLDITPGLVFFPSNAFGLEMTLGNLGYENTTSKTHSPKTTTKANGFNFRLGLSHLTIGIAFHLGRIASE